MFFFFWDEFAVQVFTRTRRQGAEVKESLRGAFCVCMLLGEPRNGRNLAVPNTGVAQQAHTRYESPHQNNLSIRDMFDLVVGTSTGGVVALGLA